MNGDGASQLGADTGSRPANSPGAATMTEDSGKDRLALDCDGHEQLLTSSAGSRRRQLDWALITQDIWRAQPWWRICRRHGLARRIRHHLAEALRAQDEAEASRARLQVTQARMYARWVHDGADPQCRPARLPARWTVMDEATVALAEFTHAARAVATAHRLRSRADRLPDWRICARYRLYRHAAEMSDRYDAAATIADMRLVWPSGLDE